LTRSGVTCLVGGTLAKAGTEDAVRRAFQALMLCSTVSLIGAPAAARDYPFCIRGCDFGAGDCSFSSYQQCQATASGRDAYCVENPRFSARDFSAKAELQPDRSRQSKRRF
jgi:hypothetical protein